MSVCCPPYIQTFSNDAVTTIPYGAALIAQFGAVPEVKVYTFDDVHREYVKDPYPVLSLKAGVLLIDHGGVGLSGYIKLS